MFLMTGGCFALRKTDSAEVYLFILQAKQPNRTILERGAGNQKSDRERMREKDNCPGFSESWDFKLCPSMLRPAELWVVERTRPPSARTTSQPATWCWRLTNGETSYAFTHGSEHKRKQFHPIKLYIFLCVWLVEKCTRWGLYVKYTWIV